MNFFHHPKVLIVDDNAANLIAMKSALQGLKIEPVFVDSGEKAIAETEQNDFAFILLDVVMPGMDGFETATRLRKQPKTATMPILFVTARDAQEKIEFEGHDQGIVDFLYKPVHTNLLRGKVHLLCDSFNYQQELQRNFEALHKFAHMAAHDLRAPIRHINYQMGIISAHLEDPERIEKSVTLMNNSTQRMSGLVDGLLSLTDIASEAMEFKKLDLNEIVVEVLHEFDAVRDLFNIDFQHSELPHIIGSRRHIHQIFHCLINNSIQYRSTDRDLVINIDSLSTGQNSYSITVKDNGIGFDNSLAESILEPFTRAVARRDYPGAGMGLAVVTRAVELHNGQVRAHGDPGKGAEFTITLPVAQSQTQSQFQTALTNDEAIASSPLGRR
ncbi:MAG: response regulator [Cohaesibacteraceae bacterium]|nr:response regulator [Cohaesibacteraceae bacterium]